MEQDNDSSLALDTVKSSVIQLLSKVLHRAMGIFSMLILARLLTPADFGVVATCTLIAFFLNSIVALGSQQYIVMLSHVSDDDLNTAWTINLLTKSLMFVALILLAPYLLSYLDKPEVRFPLYALAAVFPLSALGTPGMWLYIRDLNYRPSFLVQLLSKIVATTVTIFLAFSLRSYWALIVGTMVSYMLPSILSYRYSTYRPKLCLAGARKQFDFSKWMLINGIVGFSRAEADTIIATKTFSIESLGIYSMFRNIASILSVQVMQPALDPLLSTFSQANRGPEGLKPHHVNATLLAAGVALIPISAWILMFSNDITLLLLGSKWTEHSATLGILSLGIFPAIVQTIVSNILISKGGISVVSRFGILSAAFALTVLVAVSYRGQLPEDYAKLQLLVSTLSTLVLLTICNSMFHAFRFYDLLLITSPLLPTAIAFSTVTWLAQTFPVKIADGLLPFIGLSCAFWITFALALVLVGLSIKKDPSVGLLKNTITQVVIGSIRRVFRGSQR
ncbi:oligosaccharide flippase family protein [Congregibacter litoralis]|uniref:Membrane protein involved in the export of O-antigen and teichoic acid n=1 Tax=Congregibacter litoralis KT71 TaxID=314285 RepID=A4A560_9GAMM|nr:oligosaccharide flippase family protein [Congregibacter litoralis]EAQ98931.1 Membrane protein involved in the export of O-antigen and teichoic acid [Congregibacter litoralis KT71]